jgi:hypothetical protein
MYTYIYTLMLLVILSKYSDDEIKKTEMGRACSMYWEEERCVEFWWGYPWEGTT